MLIILFSLRFIILGNVLRSWGDAGELCYNRALFGTAQGYHPGNRPEMISGYSVATTTAVARSSKSKTNTIQSGMESMGSQIGMVRDIKSFMLGMPRLSQVSIVP